MKTTKEIVKEMNQVSRKIDSRFEKLGKLITEKDKIIIKTDLLDEEITILESRIKALTANHAKAKKESKK